MSKKAKKRVSLSIGAFLATLSIITLTSGPAYAAEPGESNTWNGVTDGPGQVNAPFGLAEARDTAGTPNTAKVWVDVQNQIHVSYNNGPAKIWIGSDTVFPPAITWTRWGWRVFHTGIDNHVYYAGFTTNADNTVNLGSWVQLPNNVLASAAPAVTGLNDYDREEWMLSYRGMDGNLYTQYHVRDTNQNYFTTPTMIPGTGTPNAPAIATTSITANNVYINRGIFIDWTGNNGQLYMDEQDYGSNTWHFEGSVGGSSDRGVTPSIAFAGNSEHGLVAQTAESPSGGAQYIRTATFSVTPTSTSIGYWQPESTGWRTNLNPVLDPWANGIYILDSDTYSTWWYKQIYSWAR